MSSVAMVGRAGLWGHRPHWAGGIGHLPDPPSADFRIPSGRPRVHATAVGARRGGLGVGRNPGR